MPSRNPLDEKDITPLALTQAVDETSPPPDYLHPSSAPLPHRDAAFSLLCQAPSSESLVIFYSEIRHLLRHKDNALHVHSAWQKSAQAEGLAPWPLALTSVWREGRGPGPNVSTLPSLSKSGGLWSAERQVGLMANGSRTSHALLL